MQRSKYFFVPHNFNAVLVLQKRCRYGNNSCHCRLPFSTLASFSCFFFFSSFINLDDTFSIQTFAGGQNPSTSLLLPILLKNSGPAGGTWGENWRSKKPCCRMSTKRINTTKTSATLWLRSGKGCWEKTPPREGLRMHCWQLEERISLRSLVSVTSW